MTQIAHATSSWATTSSTIFKASAMNLRSSNGITELPPYTQPSHPQTHQQLNDYTLTLPYSINSSDHAIILTVVIQF